MPGRLPRLLCTAAVAVATVLAPVSGPAAADPSGDSSATTPGGRVPPERARSEDRSVAELLTDLRRLHREAERATEAYHATDEQLAGQYARTRRLERTLTTVRLSLHDSRGAAGLLARQQYQSSTGLSPYVRLLLLARDPQHALNQGHVIGRLARVRAATVSRLTSDERRADTLARRARKTLDDRLTLTERRGRQHAEVRERLAAVEELLASLTPGQLAALAELERTEATGSQTGSVTSGAPGTGRAPSAAGGGAPRYAVERPGRPDR